MILTLVFTTCIHTFYLAKIFLSSRCCGTYLKVCRARLSTNSDFYDSLLAMHLLWSNPFWEFGESETRVATAWQSLFNPFCEFVESETRSANVFENINSWETVLWIPFSYWLIWSKCFFFFQFCDAAQVLLIIGKYIFSQIWLYSKFESRKS